MKSGKKKVRGDIRRFEIGNHPRFTRPQPIDSVHWVDRRHLVANDYNPNRVAKPEMDLLARSIAETGWTQPIVVDDQYTIIDGFHRYTISETKELISLTQGLVPVVIVKSVDETHRRMATIRHNRARGSHGVLDMASIVTYLMKEQNISVKELMERLGMEDEEIYRLAVADGMPAEALKKNKGMGQAWKPG